jgi:hypothetical protein
MKKSTLTKELLEQLHLSDYIFEEETSFRFAEYVGNIENHSMTSKISEFLKLNSKENEVLELKSLHRKKEVEITFDDEYVHVTIDKIYFNDVNIKDFKRHLDYKDLTVKKVNHKKKVFDCLYTADGHEIFWLHDYTQKTIEYPDSELYLDRYTFYEVCEKLIKEGAEFDNYVFEEEEIEEMKPYLESI